jgi:hypothetical protein
MSKTISIISLVAAVLASLGAFADRVPVWAAAVIVIGSALFGALSEGFAKSLDSEAWTLLGIVGTALGTTATAIAAEFPQYPFAVKIALGLTMASTALVAASKKLGSKPGDAARGIAILLVPVILFSACDKEMTLAQVGLGVNTGIGEAYFEVKTRHEAGKITDQEAADLYFTLKQSQNASDSLNAALDKIGEIENFAGNKAQALGKIREATFQLDGVVTAAAKLSDGEFAEKLKFALRSGKLGLTAAEGAVLALSKPTPATAVVVKVKS